MGATFTKVGKYKRNTLLLATTDIQPEYWGLWGLFKKELRDDGFSTKKQGADFVLNYWHTMTDESEYTNDDNVEMWRVELEDKVAKWEECLEILSEAKQKVLDRLSENAE